MAQHARPITGREPLRGWASRPFAALDLETTGLDVDSDRIVEAALLVVRSDGSVDPASFTCLVNPGVPIPPEAQAVHGIDDSHVAASGVAAYAALGVLAGRMRQLGAADIPLVVFNAPFDWPLLCAEAARYDMSMPDDIPILDPSVIDRQVVPERDGSRTLANVAAAYGMTHRNAHTARGDAWIAERVMREMLRRFPGLMRLDPGELHAAQVVWSAEQWRLRSERDPERTPPKYPWPGTRPRLSSIS